VPGVVARADPDQATRIGTEFLLAAAGLISAGVIRPLPIGLLRPRRLPVRDCGSPAVVRLPPEAGQGSRDPGGAPGRDHSQVDGGDAGRARDGEGLLQAPGQVL